MCDTATRTHLSLKKSRAVEGRVMITAARQVDPVPPLKPKHVGEPELHIGHHTHPILTKQWHVDAFRTSNERETLSQN